MEKKKSFFSRNQSLTVAISVLASVVAVAGFVYATTIGTNISVDGTLTATGASTLTGNVSAGGTLSVTGASTLSTTTVQGSFNTGAITATGTAASSFNSMVVNGTLGVTGVSTLTGGLTSLSVTGASTLSTTTVQGSFNTGAITATGTAASVFNNLTVLGTCTSCSNAFAYLFTPTTNLGLVMSATSTNIFTTGSAGYYASGASLFSTTTAQGSFNTGAFTATTTGFIGTTLTVGGTITANTAASTFSTTTVQGYFNTGIITATSSITTNNLTVNGTCTGCSTVVYPFTPTSNLGQTMSATSSSLYTTASAGFYASGVSSFASTTSTTLNVGTVTATGTVASSFNNIVVNASSTHTGITNLSGTLIAGGGAGVSSSTPAKALGVAGDAYISNSGTTTLYIKTAGAGASGAGSCIEMLDGNGAVNRVFITPGTPTLVVQVGTCK